MTEEELNEILIKEEAEDTKKAFDELYSKVTLPSGKVIYTSNSMRGLLDEADHNPSERISDEQYLNKKG